MELIDKAALIAEIEKLKAYLQIPNAQLEAIKVCDNIISVINTLEVKDVDLEKEKDDYWNKLCNSEFGELLERDAKWFDDIAKHFFELGLKTQKGK